MGAVEHSSGLVESQLSALEDSYDSFSINQRTVSVPTPQYEQKREGSKNPQIELYAKVTNDTSDVLYVDTDIHRVLPSTTASVDDGLEETVRETVKEKTGIECEVEGIAGVTILGIRDEDDTDRNPIYRLAVLFEADSKGGSVGENATWDQYDPDAHPVYV